MRRRDFFARTSDGLLGAAFAHLFAADLGAADSPPGLEPPYNLKPKNGHHPARAKSVIQLFMNGGPSQMDLFDPKPLLRKYDGQPFPGNIESIGNSNPTEVGVVMGGQYEFRRHGECGMWMADPLPHLAELADD
ncbi:MAG: DUF1501 domain-containing protein, partial [Verrucomicrobiae bacterium]|nr:DUF1501 domain-containing protein [Verrucomicrobiae bacterium]